MQTGTRLLYIMGHKRLCIRGNVNVFRPIVVICVLKIAIKEFHLCSFMHNNGKNFYPLHVIHKPF